MMIGVGMFEKKKKVSVDELSVPCCQAELKGRDC